MDSTCTRCLNDTRNPIITIRGDLCQVCRSFDAGYSLVELDRELCWLLDGGFRAMVGVSGGKDSTATLWAATHLFRELSAFTFETGYYPAHLATQAQLYAAKLGVPHELIDIRRHITPPLREAYRLTAEFYERPASDFTKGVSQADLAHLLYVSGRQHYSVKDEKPVPFLRTCILCRKVVIPAYYREAVARGVQIVVLGMNEWTHLSGKTISAVRRLQPFPEDPPVYIVHLPFLLKWTLEVTKKCLDWIEWVPPRNEDLVETNGNSCCLARASQLPFQRLLGFHPDTTRLSREITCGFLDREVARAKLQMARPYERTVRRVLEDAGIL